MMESICCFVVPDNIYVSQINAKYTLGIVSGIILLKMKPLQLSNMYQVFV